MIFSNIVKFEEIFYRRPFFRYRQLYMYVKVEYDGSNSLDMTTRIIILQDQIPAGSHILLTQLYGVHIYVYSKSAVYDM